jgi:hypothetical protein
MYIGFSTYSMKKRWSEHIRDSQRETSGSYNTHFHNAIRKYGEDSFEHEVIEEYDNEILSEAEVYWISYYNTFKNPEHYNMTEGGDAPYSEGRKKLMSEKMSGENNPMFGKTPNLGKKYTDKHKESLRNSWTDKRKKLMSENMSGENHPMFGKHHSCESSKKISISKSNTYIITDPEGNEFEVTNLKQWCIENNMNQGHMNGLARGIRKHHKNYLCRYK